MPMATIALQQVSSSYAQENSRRTLEKPIGLKFIASYISSDLLIRLEEFCKEDPMYVEGSKAERSQQTYKMVNCNALVLFRQGSTVFKFGVVIAKTENSALGKNMWGKDRDGESWSTIYFFARLVDKTISAAKINAHLNRSPNDNWQGLVVLNMKKSEKLMSFFGRNSMDSNARNSECLWLIGC